MCSDICIKHIVLEEFHNLIKSHGYTSSYFVCFFLISSIKGKSASKYGLASQPRLVDIIAAVPQQYKKVKKLLLMNWRFYIFYQYNSLLFSPIS